MGGGSSAGTINPSGISEVCAGAVRIVTGTAIKTSSAASVAAAVVSTAGFVSCRATSNGFRKAHETDQQCNQPGSIAQIVGHLIEAGTLRNVQPWN